MIRDYMSVLAARALYEDGAMVIALLGDSMRGTVSARFAGKGKLVRWSEGFVWLLWIRSRNS
jgi:hypothetical protein